MEIFLARQAIFNRNKEVVAYELLFRNSLRNSYDTSVNSQSATYALIQNILLLGLENIVNNKKAFINCDENVLKSDAIFLLPKDKIVIEILETVEPTEEIIERLRELKEYGYILALDDVISVENLIAFAPYITIVKVDNLQIQEETKIEIIKISKDFRLDLLAEKIESEKEFTENYNYGMSYFQGYYFSKPSILKGKDANICNSILLQILAELDKKNLDIDFIENLIKSDIGLTYKLLNYVNSTDFSLNTKVSSIKQAILLIGINDLKKWFTIIAFLQMNKNQSPEYTDIFIIRAKFCEIIANRIWEGNSSEAFMVGVFSEIGSIIEENSQEVINKLPLNDTIKDALFGRDNILKNILKLVISYEDMEIENVQEICRYLDIDPLSLRSDYLNAIKWAEKLKLC